MKGALKYLFMLLLLMTIVIKNELSTGGGKLTDAVSKLYPYEEPRRNEKQVFLDHSVPREINQSQTVVGSSAPKRQWRHARYDLREQGRAPQIRDQGDYGTCWAFAALSSLESALLQEEAYQFSPDHMSLSNSFHLKQVDGGDYTMGMAYLSAWQGPVYEADDPYGDKRSQQELAAVKHVQEMRIIQAKDYARIKKAVYQYGGVQSSIHINITGTAKRSFFDRETNSYRYVGTAKPNHDILIIGWDDNYPKENFNIVPANNGAFICQNSWGKCFGEQGVFYISYDDAWIGSHNVVYTKIENKSNYDNIYQADLCGWVGQLGYDGESVYGTNVYTAKRQEELRAAGFYATDTDTRYKLYIARNFKGAGSLTDRRLVATGDIAEAGFYTISFEEAVLVEAGEKYAVILYIETAGSIHPLAIEYRKDEATNRAVIEDGEGYISKNGEKWERIEKTQNSNICLKVYSDNR